MIHLQNAFIISIFIILCLNLSIGILNLVLVFFMIKFNYVIGKCMKKLGLWFGILKYAIIFNLSKWLSVKGLSFGLKNKSDSGEYWR